MLTDGQNGMKEQKTHFCTFLSRTPPNTYTVNVYCCWLVVPRDRVNVMLSVLLYSIMSAQIVYSVQMNCTDSNYRQREWLMLSVLQYSTLTVQILYKMYTLQLNCSYSNYTEAAATCSAAQQHTNCQADVFWSEVQTAVWNYILTCIQRLDPSDSRHWLLAQCRNLIVIRNKWMLQR
jgi:hypothetical protein